MLIEEYNEKIEMYISKLCESFKYKVKFSYYNQSYKLINECEDNNIFESDRIVLLKNLLTAYNKTKFWKVKNDRKKEKQKTEFIASEKLTIFI
jgi:DNA polymerase III delta subunit